MEENEALGRSEDLLNKAMREFEDACGEFLRNRRLSQKTWVEVCARNLLETSEAHERLKSAIERTRRTNDR